VHERIAYPVTVAAGGEPWCKGRALWNAIRRSHADVLVIHDADCWTDGLEAAVAACAAPSGDSWAIPHRTLRRLSDDGTAAVLAGADWRDQPLAERPYVGVVGGGVVCIRRDVALDVPMDPRMVGWGGDDEAWAMALWMLHGPPWRGDSDLVHLYHPPQRRLNRRIGSEENWALYQRYRQARRDRALMLQLVAEAHYELEHAPHPARHDPVAVAG
jgi:hypothetical protein